MHPNRVQDCRPDGSLCRLLRHRKCTFTMWSCVDVVATLYVLLHLKFIMGGRCLRRGVRRVTKYGGERMQRNSFRFLPSVYLRNLVWNVNPFERLVMYICPLTAACKPSKRFEHTCCKTIIVRNTVSVIFPC